jgi:hypothetical protein
LCQHSLELQQRACQVVVVAAAAVLVVVVVMMMMKPQRLDQDL